MKFQRTIFLVSFLAIVTGAAWYWSRVVSRRAPLSNPASGDVVSLARWNPLFDSAVPAPQRLNLARAIDGSLPLSTVSRWSMRLGRSDIGPDAENHFAIYNEILEQSRHRNLHPSDLGSFLIYAVGSSSLHPLLRDYAAQHLALWLVEDGTGQPCETDPQRRVEGLALLCRTIGDADIREETLAGTAMLALADLEARQPGALASHWTALDQSLAALISRAETSRSLRLSAIQMAANAGRSSHLPAIRLLVADPSLDEGVLLAAVAALGKLGDRSDRVLLTPIVDAGGIAATAATASLARLKL